MPYFLLHDVGTAGNSATLVRWLAGVGESMEAGHEFAEFETDHGRLIVTAPSAARFAEPLIVPGQTVPLGAKLLRVEGAVAADSPTAITNREDNAVTEAASSGAGGTVIPLLMPQAGNTMEEGTVVAWNVKEGDQIAVGDVICEIETDKATMDFESPDAGRLARIVAPLNEPVAVKNIIALLADSDADADAYLANQASGPASARPVAAQTTSPPTENGAESQRPPAPAPVTATGRVKASPAARKLAAERGISLSAVSVGSGPGGRVLSSDLENLAPHSTSALAGGETRRPLSKMRRAIGLNLQQSKQTVPHFYVRTSINADALLAFYRTNKQQAHCSLNDVIVLAVGRAIRDFPAVRSQIVGQEIVEYPHANIGIAVGIEDGLVVPVVLKVDTLSLGQLAAATKQLVEQARMGRLENIGKGHFTISNLGMYGIEEFSAIINPPESGILAVSAAREAVIVEHGAMRVGHQMTLTLSADHRIVDGVVAARFMQRLRAILENPTEELA